MLLPIEGYQKKMAHYWDPNDLRSFQNLHRRLLECSQKVEALRMKCLSDLSGKLFKERWDEFKDLIQELNEIRSGLDEPCMICASALTSALKSESTFSGDFQSFSNRVETLQRDLSEVYKTKAYPLLLIFENVRTGWDPNSFVCLLSDAYKQWRVVDPEKEIKKALN